MEINLSVIKKASGNFSLAQKNKLLSDFTILGYPINLRLSIKGKIPFYKSQFCSTILEAYGQFYCNRF